MNANIVEMISSHIGSGAISSLSSAIGETPDRTRTAVGAAVPTLLAGLTHVASTPDGARRLSSLASEHADSGTAGNFASMPSTAGVSTQDKGSSALGSLFGGGTLATIASALGRFTGLKGGAVTGLLGTLAPLILGVLGKQQKSMGLDAGGLGNFLAGQKQNIAAAMPSGLGGMLGNIPGLSGFAQQEAPEPAYRDSYSERSGREPDYNRTTASDTHERRPSSARKWMPALLAVCAAIALLWGWNNRRSAKQGENQVAQQETIIKEPAGAARSDTAGLTTKLSDTFTSATMTLDNVTDATSAENALPQIKELNAKIAGMKSEWNGLPASAKPAAAAAIQPSVSKLQEQVDKLKTMPGVSDKLKPMLDQLESNLSSFSVKP